MDSDFDDIIEVAGGGGDLTFTDMIYYDSWTQADYTFNITDDVISYTCPNLASSDNTVVGASLWLFNDGTTPLPSNKIKYYLSNPAITKYDYTGIIGACSMTIRPILNAFDPSLITSVSDLMALTSSIVNTLFRWRPRVQDFDASGINESSVSELLYFELSQVDTNIFGVVIEFSNGPWGNVSAIDADIQANNEILKVVLQ